MPGGLGLLHCAAQAQIIANYVRNRRVPIASFSALSKEGA